MDKIEFLRQRVEEEKKKNDSKLEEEKLEREYNELKSKNKLLEKKKGFVNRFISRINQGKKKNVPVRIVYKYKPRRRTNFRSTRVMYRPTIRKPMIKRTNDNLFNQLMRL
jgi:hypothetical protein